jgi:1-aminocyclopropane-1-carboxylate deaminase/D-cysteine desulfhydrase-like pyridoxal-dependent ACC family enzyme
MEKGNMLISYIFESDDVIQNVDADLEMQRDLQKLAEEWKKKGYIRRYVIAPDDVISENIKQ